MPKKKKKTPRPKKKIAARKKPLRKKKARPAGKKSRRKAGSRGVQEVTTPVAIRSRRGLGAASGGQSGDIQGLSRDEFAESESVEELVEEGQSYESELVSGVENARDPDQGEVTTSEVPEDDVPPEYQDRDKL